METIVADPHLRNESVELGFDQHRSQYRFENRLAASVQMLGDPEYGAATRTAQLPTSGASSSARLTDRARAGESAMAGAGPNDRVRAQSTNVRNGVVTASTAGACAQCRTTDSLLGRRWRCRGMVTCGIAGAGDGESHATCHTGQLRDFESQPF
ncbi:MAG TPA: hypothetical protein VFG33_00575 [Kribbella sp.]|uniref:hypothetical protein n=1 Tax=Kribbella sp. TaxID=1871183 RepID=UPI002D79B91C|nr:hypothetical protein [Kribbella sp.]HET6291825.1 hypothetical protein [Kribbella sp.]